MADRLILGREADYDLMQRKPETAADLASIPALRGFVRSPPELALTLFARTSGLKRSLSRACDFVRWILAIRCAGRRPSRAGRS
jgi:hypothetical protein